MAPTIGSIVCQLYPVLSNGSALLSIITHPPSSNERDSFVTAPEPPTRLTVSAISSNLIAHFWPNAPFPITRRSPFTTPSSSSLSPLSSTYRESDPYEYKRAALAEYLDSEPVLQIQFHESSSMYNVSCGIQLALLYWTFPDSDWGPTFRESGLQAPFLKFRRRELKPQQP